MCGNDFIRQLKARIERRDEEIARLRREVARLRMVNAGLGLGGDVGPEGEPDYDLDLEKDLDAVEMTGNGHGSFFSAARRSTSLAADDDIDEDTGDV